MSTLFVHDPDVSGLAIVKTIEAVVGVERQVWFVRQTVSVTEDDVFALESGSGSAFKVEVDAIPAHELPRPAYVHEAALQSQKVVVQVAELCGVLRTLAEEEALDVPVPGLAHPKADVDVLDDESEQVEAAVPSQLRPELRFVVLFEHRQ